MKITVKTFLASIAIAALTQSVQAQFTPYTNSTDFFNAITASNFTESYDSFTPGNTNSPLSFSNNGFSYTALAGEGFLVIDAGSSDFWLSINGSPLNTITFTNFSPNVSAFGGNFFSTDLNGAYTNSPISIIATLVDSTTFSTNYFPGGPFSYLGLTFTANLSSVVIGNESPAEEFITANDVTVGVVPEPSTYALLGLAAVGLAGYVVRRRRR